MRMAMDVSQAAALLAGKNESGRVYVDIDPATLSEAERAEAAVRIRRDERTGESLPIVPGGEHAEATPETLRAALRGLIAERAGEKALAAARIEAAVQRILAAPKTDWTEKCADGRPVGYHYPSRYDEPSITWDDPRVAARVSEMRAYWDPQIEETRRITAEQAVERQAAAVAAAADQAAKVVDLREWAEAHGSDLLRARITEQFEWQSLARREFADAVMAKIAGDLQPADDPSTQDGWSSEFADRDRPTLAEIQALRDVRDRAKSAGCTVTAGLKWMTYTCDDPSGDEDEEKIQRTEIEIEISTPDGQTVTRYLLPPAQAQLSRGPFAILAG